jgi:hypothetical protein
MNSTPEPLEVERLIPSDARRVSVEDHQSFREAIAPKPDFDEIDELVAELRELNKEASES